MPFPLIPICISSASSLAAAAGGWAFIKIKEIDSQIAWIKTTTQQLQASTAAAHSGSMWAELLIPLAKEWSAPLTRISYGLSAASAGVICLGFAAWYELRMFRFEIQLLRRENDRLLSIITNSKVTSEALTKT
jgi:hypothetical protein